MFYTFIVLYLGEHLFGIWGLIVGIPLFTFLLDLMKIKQVPSIRNALKKSESNEKV